MADAKKRLRRATTIYWIFLLYIIAALIWWFISLEQQNRMMYDLKLKQIATSDIGPKQYHEQEMRIRNEKRRNTFKYIGEGSTFLLLIIFGAVFIYRTVRRQFKVQQQQQNFVMAITHELKTPIAVTRLNLETLLRYHLEELKQKKMLEVSLHETMRLDSLINNILISSQLDNKKFSASKEELDFSNLTNDVINSFKSRYPDKKINLDIETDIDLNGDPVLLKLLISNLLENANKYAPKPSPIHLKLFRNDGTVQLNVVDEGTGIDDKQKTKIFEKFYRIGDEQTRTTQGTGLGLFICKKIADAHNASIAVHNNKPHGSNFEVRFSQ
ncbi:MAG: two-component sensor histidine kinase [Chitinophagaceae bacterium]|nr:two-component sensor histidine kinase [Chitinophagaceae bacterium]